MTEQEWLTSSDPAAMLRWLTRHPRGYDDSVAAEYYPSDRKLRLFACACCRQVWDELNPLQRDALDFAERFADDSCPPLHKELDLRIHAGAGCGACAFNADAAALNFTRDEYRKGMPLSTGACFLRDIFGNPRRKVELCTGGVTSADQSGSINYAGTLKVVKRSVAVSPAVLSIAQGIYEERAFDRMPILWDALADAGCEEESVLEHCKDKIVRACVSCNDSFIGQRFGICTRCGRETCGNCASESLILHRDRQCDFFNANGPGHYVIEAGPHVRGCWVLDLILGLF